MSIWVQTDLNKLVDADNSTYLRKLQFRHRHLVISNLFALQCKIDKQHTGKNRPKEEWPTRIIPSSGDTSTNLLRSPQEEMQGVETETKCNGKECHGIPMCRDGVSFGGKGKYTRRDGVQRHTGMQPMQEGTFVGKEDFGFNLLYGRGR